MSSNDGPYTSVRVVLDLITNSDVLLVHYCVAYSGLHMLGDMVLACSRENAWSIRYKETDMPATCIACIGCIDQLVDDANKYYAHSNALAGRR